VIVCTHKETLLFIGKMLIFKTIFTKIHHKYSSFFTNFPIF
jgi:hypothetical protein